MAEIKKQTEFIDGSGRLSPTRHPERSEGSEILRPMLPQTQNMATRPQDEPSLSQKDYPTAQFIDRRVWQIAFLLILSAIVLGLSKHLFFLSIKSELHTVIHPWSLAVLPSEIHGLVALLILIPLGLLVVAVFRNVIGISTLGTFTPVLLAIALRETSLIFGLAFLVVSGLIGGFTRAFLGRLYILLIPRLSIVLTVVATTMLIIVLVSYYQGIVPTDYFSLLSMVIITWLIERFTILQIEHGTQEALKAAAGTLFVAVVTYKILKFHLVLHVLLLYPETIFVITALLLLLGRYSGIRWTEYHRFRELMKNETPEK